MITVTKDIVVERDPEAVYDFLADVRNEERWNPNAVSIEAHGPLAVGDTFEGIYRQGGRMRFQLVEAVRPNTLVFEGGGSRTALVATLSIAGVGSTTRVSIKAEMEPRGALRLLAPLMPEARPRSVPARRCNAGSTTETTHAYGWFHFNRAPTSRLYLALNGLTKAVGAGSSPAASRTRSRSAANAAPSR